MSTIMLDLGHAILVKPGLQTFINIAVNALLLVDHSLPSDDANLISSRILQDTVWLPRSSAVDVSFTFILHCNSFRDIHTSLLERQTLCGFLEKFELWETLDLHLTTLSVEHSSTTCSPLRIDIKTCLRANTPRLDTAEGKVNLNDFSNIHPPKSVHSCKLSSISIFLEFGQSDLPERSSHTLRPNLLRACKNGEDCYHILKPPSSNKEVDLEGAPSHAVSHRDLHHSRTRQSFHQKSVAYEGALLSLLDVALRRSISPFSIYTPGVKCVEENWTGRLIEFAPATFKPGFAAQLAQRTTLIGPIAQALTKFLHESQNSDSQRRCMASESMSTNEQLSHQLWVTMVHKLKSVEPSTRLRRGNPSQVGGKSTNHRRQNEAGDLETGIIPAGSLDKPSFVHHIPRSLDSEAIAKVSEVVELLHSGNFNPFPELDGFELDDEQCSIGTADGDAELEQGQNGPGYGEVSADDLLFHEFDDTQSFAMIPADKPEVVNGTEGGFIDTALLEHMDIDLEDLGSDTDHGSSAMTYHDSPSALQWLCRARALDKAWDIGTLPKEPKRVAIPEPQYSLPCRYLPYICDMLEPQPKSTLSSELPSNSNPTDNADFWDLTECMECKTAVLEATCVMIPTIRADGGLDATGVHEWSVEVDQVLVD